MFDCIIVLGFTLKDKKKLPSVLKSRLDTAISLYSNSPESKLIMCGGLSNSKLKITEAEAMKQYAVSRGIEKRDIIKEDTSTDTIGNAFFIKQRILKPNKWRNIALVTSGYHLRRAKIIFKKVMGKGYRIKFIGVRAFDAHSIFYKILGIENDFTELTHAFFKNIKDGDDKQIKKLIKRIHPLYSEKGLQELLKLSNEEIAKRLGIDVKIIKKIRKYVERKVKLSGRLKD